MLSNNIFTIHLSHHKRSAFIRDITGLDQDHLEAVQMVLTAVVKVLQLLLEAVKDLPVAGHVRGQDQDDHVLRGG